MNEAGGGEPDAEEDGDELAESDAVARSQDVQVLKDVGNRHQPYRSQKPQTCRHDTIGKKEVN